jgi:oligopeptide/dipeptide ABC transporter ATP-binding protein
VTQGRPAREERRKPALLRVDGLTKSFAVQSGLFSSKKDLVHAVRGVSFELQVGETLGVVGESGCGKSTLGRMVTKLIEPTFGRVFIVGRDVTHLRESEFRPFRRRVQIVFQDPRRSLDPRLSVRRIVSEGPEAFDVAPNVIAARLDAVLDAVGLPPEVADRYPEELSGGERQRVALARSLVLEPELLVCDEITSALDVTVQTKILALLRTRQIASGLACLFITHDLALAERHCKNLLVMYAGGVVEMGSAESIAEDPRHPYTKALFAASPRPSVAFAPVEPRRLPLKHEVATRGCSYAPKCDQFESGVCDREAPTLERHGPGPGHRVACFKA